MSRYGYDDSFVLDYIVISWPKVKIISIYATDSARTIISNRLSQAIQISRSVKLY